MELLCRLRGFGSTAAKPEWSQFCSPPEQELLDRILALGKTRKELDEYMVKCELLGTRGLYMVAAMVNCVRKILHVYDTAIVHLSGNLQSDSPFTLNSLFSVASEHEGSLGACHSYMAWVVDDVKPDELFHGKLLDVCYQKVGTSYGNARQAYEDIFAALFEAFKRTLIPWLAYGFFDSGTHTFFIKEPTECRVYFREIAPLISDRLKAPDHFSGNLVEKIAQNGYIRKFLGWRTKNILGDPVLEYQLVVLCDRLRHLHWKDYRSRVLEDIVDSFGQIYSQALFVNIFNKCRVQRILQCFQEMFLMGFVDLFDDFVALADGSLGVLWANQTNAANDANIKLDLAFDGTTCRRKYDRHIQSGGTSSLTSETIADRCYDAFYFVINECSHAETKPVWDSLELNFAIQHPLEWFFHPRAMSKYKQIFRFLLRLKRLNNAFCDLWRALQDAAMSNRLQPGDHLDLFYWQYTFMHIMSAIQGYIQVDVIGEAWLELQEKIARLDDYMQLMEAHDEFLAQIMRQSLIDNERMMKSINALVKSSLEVAQGVCVQLDRARDEEINLTEIRDTILNLYSILRMFVKLVQSTSDGNNQLGTFLSMKLDFNDNLSRALGRSGFRDNSTVVHPNRSV